jgi:N-acyl homoserine lactone hydrolase
MNAVTAMSRAEPGSAGAVKAVSVISTGTNPALAPFTESLDVLGDGSLVLLPTPGHTAGSVSLLIRRAAKPPLLLAGDLTYGADILQRGQVPGVGNRRRLAESSRKVLALAERQPGLVVLPAHDPTAAQRLLNS